MSSAQSHPARSPGSSERTVSRNWQLPLRDEVAHHICRFAIPVLYGLGLIALSAAPFLAPSQPTRLVPAIVGLTLIGGAHLLLRRGRPRLAADLILGALVSVILVAMVLNGGVLAPAYGGVLAVVVLAASLHGARGAIALLGAFVLCGLLAIEAMDRGWLPERPLLTPYVVWGYHVIWGTMALAFALIPALCARRALDRSEEAGRAAEEARRAEAERRASLDAVLDHTRHHLCLLSSTGEVIHANAQVLGHTTDPSSVIGRAYEELPSWKEGEGQRVRTAIRHARAGAASRWSLEREGEDGMPRHYECGIHPVYGQDGSLEFLIAEVSDVTESLRARAARDRSDRAEAVGRMAADIAHDFNNMLGAITNSAELLQLSLPGRTEGRDPRPMLDAILQAADRSRALTTKLLAFSKGRHGPSAHFTLDEVIEDTVELLRRTLPRNIELEVASCERPVPLHGDRALLESALVNLALNARDAMPEGGKLTLSCAVAQEDGGVPEARIQVADTGRGIESRHIDQVFEPFFTTKPAGRGTGLGLAAVARTVREMGGEIGVNSRPGEGTTFTITLPTVAGDAASAVPAEATRTETSPLANVRVLLVEDEELVREALAEVLRERGIQVEEVPDGARALNRLERGGAAFDAVITDVAMPDVDGGELLRRLRAAQRDVPVLVMSGCTDGHELELELDDRVRFLRKPFRTETLEEALTDLIATREGQNLRP